MRTCLNDKKGWGGQVLRKVLSVCVFLLMGINIVRSAEVNDTIDGVIYTLNDATMTAMVKGVEDKSISHANILEKITQKDLTYKVTQIGYQCFYQCKDLEYINIPPSVTEIQSYGIANCEKLATLILPSSVNKLGNRAFAYNTNMTSIKLSENLTELPFSCFTGCKMLHSITVPLGVRVLGRNCFYSCLNLKTVIIMSEDFSIDALCFNECRNLKTIVTHSKTPQKIKYEETAHLGMIPQIPRYGKNLYVPKESVNLYKNAEGWNTWENIEPLENYIGEDDENPWALEQVNGKYYVAGMFFELNQQDQSACFTGVDAGYYWSHSAGLGGASPNDFVNNVNIPMYVYYKSKEYTVTRLSDKSLSGYLHLSMVSIPSTVKEIGNSCFSNSGCNFASLPEGVEKLGNECFGYCYVKKMELPSSITSIGDYCFSECSILTSVTIHSHNLDKIGKGCFAECGNLNELVCYSNQVPAFEFDERYNQHKSPFYGTKAHEGTLYVQKHLVDSYKATEGWNEWKIILPIESYGLTDGIDNMNTEVNDNAVIYDLQGRKVLTPQRGRLYIKNGKKYIYR
ncbi:MAG: leucine-rich repeat domain-containing protein [Prevotella sp.]|nr:leucine-rich repeat domain-containing protein [Prevotella sp.]